MTGLDGGDPSAPRERFAPSPAPSGWIHVARLEPDRFGERHLVRAPGGEGAPRQAILRRLRVELSDSSDYERALRAEARVAAACFHENLARVMSFGRDDQGLFVVQEHEPWLTLDEIILRMRQRRRHLSVTVIVEILMQASHGLRAARALAGQGAARGAVSPLLATHDVAVSISGRVKLVAAGLASGALSTSARADEQLRPRDDVAALASLAFRLLTLRAPPPAEAAVDRATQLDALLVHARQDVPLPLRQILARSFTGDGALRYAGSLDVTADLAGLQQDERQGAAILARFVEQIGVAASDELTAAPEAELDDRETRPVRAHLPDAGLRHGRARLARGSAPPPDAEDDEDDEDHAIDVVVADLEADLAADERTVVADEGTGFTPSRGGKRGSPIMALVLGAVTPPPERLVPPPLPKTGLTSSLPLRALTPPSAVGRDAGSMPVLPVGTAQAQPLVAAVPSPDSRQRTAIVVLIGLITGVVVAIFLLRYL